MSRLQGYHQARATATSGSEEDLPVQQDGRSRSLTHTESKKALDTMNHLMKVWVKPFGLMELLVVDQGPEFAGEEFADYFREQGVLVHFTDGQSPWQNGPTERAGGAFKEMLDKVI